MRYAILLDLHYYRKYVSIDDGFHCALGKLSDWSVGLNRIQTLRLHTHTTPIHRIDYFADKSTVAVRAYLLSQQFLFLSAGVFFYSSCSISVLLFIRTASKWPSLAVEVASLGIEVNPHYKVKSIRIFILFFILAVSKYILTYTR